MKKRIGIDARLYDESGNGRYIRNLLTNLQTIDNRNDYFVFLLAKDFDKMDFNDNFTKVLADIRWYGVKEQTEFPKLLYKYNLDLVHFPHFNVPIFYTKKFVVTLHDLIHQHFGMQRASTHNRFLYFIKKWGYGLTFKHAILVSEKIITVSNYVKKQLTREWAVKEEKVEVIYEAAEKGIIDVASRITKAQIKQTLERFNIGTPYIFYVGNAHPHKNVEGLIEAFLLIKEKHPNLTLVLAGKDHYFWQRVKSKYTHKDIKYAGFVSDEDLAALYKGAVCFVMPSFEEGFGIPLLEAFTCGCPVAASDIGALKEIGSDAALFFNPKDIFDMALVIKRVLDSEKLREELAAKGERRYKEFSWERLAKQTLDIYIENC